MQWEYVSLHVGYVGKKENQIFEENGVAVEPHDFYPRLRTLGKEGWEMIAAICEYDRAPYLYHFKRPLIPATGSTH